VTSSAMEAGSSAPCSGWGNQEAVKLRRRTGLGEEEPTAKEQRTNPAADLVKHPLGAAKDPSRLTTTQQQTLDRLRRTLHLCWFAPGR
jgi:hypothetical protein